MPSLSALRAFHATAERGSFVAAAKALNVTQAAVAQQVRGLERELGLRLTMRDGRGIRLTPEGQKLAESLRDGFARIAVGVETARGGDKTRGLRVSAAPGFASKVLLPRLAEFWEAHPDIAVTIVPDRRSVDLVAESFDLAVRAMELDDPMPDTDIDILVQSPIVAAGAPGLIAEAGGDPTALPWLTRDPFEIGLLQNAGFDTDALEFRNVGPMSMEAAAARMGYGIMICPEVMIRADLSSGELVKLGLPDLGEMAYHVVTPKGLVRPAARTYIAWLKRQMADNPM